MSKLKKVLFISLGLCLGLLLATLTRVVVAVSDSTIYGCYARTIGILRVLYPGQTCTKYETAISWNTQGTPGPAGPVGPAGPAGPAGLGGLGGFVSSDLSNTNLTQQKFIYRDFSNFKFQHTDFQGSQLIGSKFVGADLSFANCLWTQFDKADFTNANLTMVNLVGASLRGATFTGANLTDVVWGTEPGEFETYCPDNTTSSSNGGTCIGHLTP